jgi:hypothetical protein
MANPKNLKPPWKKGQSGNPKGRPRKAQTLAEFKQIVVDYYNEPTKANRMRFVELIRKLERHRTGQKALLELLAGRPPVNVDLTSGGKEITTFIKVGVDIEKL